MNKNIKHIKVGGWNGLIEVELNNGQVFFWTFKEILEQERLEAEQGFESRISFGTAGNGLFALLGQK